jgi:hypothetical protein
LQLSLVAASAFSYIERLAAKQSDAFVFGSTGAVLD